MGSVVLSLDVELAWRFHDRQTVPESRVSVARESWLRTLELFDEFDVPATWAVVGHLLLDTCDGVHSDHPTSDERFDTDPGTWEGRDEGWYGSKLVDAIEDADPDHEVASRTFSNVDLSEVTQEVASAELRRCVEVAERRDLVVDSVVFPRGNVAHRDVLAAYGAKTYRSGKPRRWYDRGPLGTAVRVFGWPTDVVSPTLVTPEEDEHGLVNLPTSLYLDGFDGWIGEAAGRFTEDPLVDMAKRGIDRAATEDGIFHVRLCANDSGDKRDFDRVRSVLEHAESTRERTTLSVETMGQVAADVKDDEPRPREPIGPR